MPQARPWPNKARDQRDEAAMQAIRGSRALRPLIDGERLSHEEVIRRQAVALDSLNVIVNLMAAAGAPIAE